MWELEAHWDMRERWEAVVSGRSRGPMVDWDRWIMNNPRYWWGIVLPVHRGFLVRRGVDSWHSSMQSTEEYNGLKENFYSEWLEHYMDLFIYEKDRHVVLIFKKLLCKEETWKQLQLKKFTP